LAVTHLVVYIIFALNHMILNEDINKYVQTETMTIAWERERRGTR